MPHPKGYGDLTPAERAKLAELLEISEEELEGRMAVAAEDAAASEMEETLLVEED